jgi:hypothetical protein
MSRQTEKKFFSNISQIDENCFPHVSRRYAQRNTKKKRCDPCGNDILEIFTVDGILASPGSATGFP